MYEDAFVKWAQDLVVLLREALASLDESPKADDPIEVRLELTQKEVNLVALALREYGTGPGWYKSEIALLERVAQKFEDAGRRDDDEPYYTGGVR